MVAVKRLIIKFNRNILYCKYKSDMLNKSNTINLIETFCIVNTKMNANILHKNTDLIGTFCIVLNFI